MILKDLKGRYCGQFFWLRGCFVRPERLRGWMASTLRCKSWKSHRDWQQNCDKARAVQLLDVRHDRNLGEGAYATARAWYPRGTTNELNNTSPMVSGVVRTSSWHTSGGLQSTYALAFGPRRAEKTLWQQELAALRAERHIQLEAEPNIREWPA